MDFFMKLAKSEVGQMAMNSVRQNVEERIKEYADAQQKNASSVAQTSNPNAQSMWPGPIDKTLRFAITAKVSTCFAIASYGDGFALVLLPNDYILYFHKDASYIHDLDYLWKEFDESVKRLSNPITVLDDLVPVMLREKEMQSDCKPVYYAIVAGFYDYCKEQKEKEGNGFSMSTVNRKGDTPVHVAARSGSLRILQLVWDDYFDPLTVNKQDQTILHVARQRPEIIKYINKHVPQDVCNSMIITADAHFKPETPDFPSSFQSIQEYTVKENLPHCLFVPVDILKKAQFSVRELETVLRILYVRDSDFLGRLHNSKNVFHTFDTFPQEHQKVLLSFGRMEMLNTRDSQGCTPMHYIAKSGSLATFILLWSHGADVNTLDNQGYFPMDYALRRDNVDIVKAFLVFSGQCNQKLLNDAIKSGRKCSETLQKHAKALQEGNSKNINFDIDNPTHRRCRNFPSLSKEDGIILSIDGGGMKGILALQLLKEIESVVGEKFLQFFNHIGGTSTGSMITLGLVKYGNIDHVIRQYFRMKDDIFVGSRPYSGEGLENVLLNEFGRQTLKELGDKKNIRISIPVARVDISPPQLYMFRSYDLHDPYFDQKALKPEWCAAKIVRGSSAAPSFFPPVDGKFMDGGLIANNPTCDILTDCQRIEFEKNKRNLSKIIVSIGTGAMQKKIENIDLMKPTTMGGIVNTFNQILHLKDVFIEQLTAADGVTVERARWMAEAMEMAYFRFTPNLEFPVAIDEKDDSALLDAMLAVKYEAMTMRNEMNMLASILKY